jgi:gluconate kinase
MARKGGNPGNKGGGRHKVKLEFEYFKKLDKALPEVLDFLVDLVNDAKKECGKQMKDKDKIEWGLKAAKIMNDKAPQRIQGVGDNGAIIVDSSEAEKYKDIVKEFEDKLRAKYLTK